MNFNEELQKLREAKEECLSEVQSIENKKNIELEQILQAKKQVIFKYDELRETKYQELGEHNNRNDAYCSMVESYSKFIPKKIGNTIASLISIFEGINYFYQEGTPYYPLQDKTKYLGIVIEETSKRNWYIDNIYYNLNLLVKNEKAIILSDDTSTLTTFYRANPVTHSLEQCVQFGRFSYVKDFIDELISYRIEHKLEYILDDELEKSKIDFISSRVEQIEENYNRLVAQQEEELKQKLAAMKQKLNNDKEKRQSQLRRILTKKENK